ncbi:RHS repeat-associated core domain-containing protein [Paracoccus amoyensis]|nr:RHS repeat-associated core domain-containing protein [Paracoccus amoyensis]
MQVASETSAQSGAPGSLQATPNEPAGSTPEMQAAIANQTDARGGFFQGWDSGLDFVESEGFQNSVLATEAVVASVRGGMGVIACATAAGTVASTSAIALAAGAALIPIAAGWLAGKAGNVLGSWAGDVVGDWMGLEPLSGPSELPACVGDKIYHAPSGLVAGLMAAAVVVGAVAAIGALAVLTVFSGGLASPLLVATTIAVVGGLTSGALSGAADSLGQQGEEKGEIRTGSPNVLFENKNVAHVSAFIDCQDHGLEKQCAEGSGVVYVNGFPLSRKGHKTTCDGTIQTGRETVLMDLTTSADQLDIDGGMLMRITRTVAFIGDFLPLPTGGKRPRPGGNTPPTPSLPNPPKPPKFPRINAAVNKIDNAFRKMEGDPVDVASGQVGEIRTDMFIPGTIPLVLTRSYSRGATGIQGNDWAGNWAQHLRLEGGAVIWQNPDGAEVMFEAPEDDVWGVNLRCPQMALLGRRSEALYLYDYNSQLFTIFNHRVGNRLLLSAIQDRNGNEISFHYSAEGLTAVHHSDGFELAVDSKGMVIRHAALGGTGVNDCVFTWQYDGERRLTQVDSSQTGHLRYGYDDQGRLNMWSDSHLTRAYFEYDRADRVIRNWSDSGHLAVELAYDIAARRTRVTDAAGVVKFFDWNDRGLVWREIDADGGEWLTRWGPACEVLERQDPLGNRWSYDYDGVGCLLRATDPEGHSETWEYDANRQPIAHIDAMGARTEFRYNARGNLVQIVDPTGAVRQYRRDQQGKLTRIELPQDRQTRIYYDALNRPTRLQMPSGSSVRMFHDTEGRMIRQIDEIGAETLMDYTRGPENQRGALRQVTLPDGTIITATYDSEGLVSSASNGMGDLRKFRYGAFDIPLETQDPQGNRVRLEHDYALRLTAVINEMGQRYELSYDRVGNLVAEKDYSGLVTRYEYDAAGRLTRRIAPNGGESRYDWSPAGLLTRSESWDGISLSVTTTVYDAAGRATRIASDDSTITRAYDIAGRMVSETVDGRQMTYTYQPGSAAPVSRGGDGLGLDLDYSADGHVSAMRFVGTELRFEHDLRGLEVLRQSAAGFTQEQGWDVMRRLTGQLVGPEMMHGRGSAARVERGYGWDRAGRAIAITDRAAGLTELRYDARGLVTDTYQQRADGSSPILRQYDYDPSRNLSGLIENMRAERIEDQAGRVRRRGHITYQHDDCGRVILKRHEEPGFRPRIWKMAWDANDRLVRLTTPDGAVWRYEYDALGRRIRRMRVIDGGQTTRSPDDWSVPDDTDPPVPAPGSAEVVPLQQRMGSAYQWDGDRIVAEAPLYADGSVAWDRAEHWVYDPGSFRPLARVYGDEVAHVVTDHIGTPRELVSADGRKVLWRAQLSLWGKVDQLEQAANDNAPPITCPIRFQGQWEDAESGLYYNRYRYYDVDAAQYLSPDPIGLDGGIRPQGYVVDPNGWVDPLGLAACIVTNRRNGRKFQQQVIDSMSHVNATENGTPYTVSIPRSPNNPTTGNINVTTIPDIMGPNVGGIIEVKDVRNLSLSRQLRAQIELANQTGQPFNLVVSPRTQYVSGPLLKAIRAGGGDVYIYDPSGSGSLSVWP